MKTNYFVLIILSVFLLNACNVGVNKDLLSGLKVSNSDLSYEESAVLLNNVKVNSPEFKIGDIIYIQVKGVAGYTEKNGLVNIGASVVVTDPSGNKIMDYPDLFEQYTDNGIAKTDASIITLHIPVDSTMVVGSKYIWKSKIWDKNSKGMINTELEFTVK